MGWSRKTIYALIFMLAAAEGRDGEKITIKTVSEKEGISVKYLEQVTAQLCKAGFIKSYRGPNGGYLLKRLPEKYTVGEIVRALDGDIEPDHYIEKLRSLSMFWEGLRDEVNNYLGSITLKDLLEDGKASNGIYDYYI